MVSNQSDPWPLTSTRSCPSQQPLTGYFFLKTLLCKHWTIALGNFCLLDWNRVETINRLIDSNAFFLNQTFVSPISLPLIIGSVIGWITKKCYSKNHQKIIKRLIEKQTNSFSSRLEYFIFFCLLLVLLIFPPFFIITIVCNGGIDIVLCLQIKF